MLTTFRAITTKREKLTNFVYRFVFKLREPTELSSTAGQYILLNIPGGFRQYSISSAPNEKGEIETVADVTPMGPGSKYLLSLNLNDEISFRAPLGLFTLKITDCPKIFLATGTGIAPLKSMILTQYEQNSRSKMTLLWGLRTKADCYYKDVFEQLSLNNTNFHFYYCLSKEVGKADHLMDCRITDALDTLFNAQFFPLNSEWYICGRPEIVEDLKMQLQNIYHIEQKYIFHEKFT